MKIYKYYYDNSLYAYTDNKKYKDMFELVRNMKIFRKQIDVYDTKEELETELNGLPANNKLIMDVLTDGNNSSYEVVCTIIESARLDDITSRLYDIETAAYHVGVNYKDYSLVYNSNNDEYLMKIRKLLKKIIPKDTSPEVNTLKLFYTLNKKTFVEERKLM